MTVSTHAQQALIAGQSPAPTRVLIIFPAARFARGGGQQVGEPGWYDTAATSKLGFFKRPRMADLTHFARS